MPAPTAAPRDAGYGPPWLLAATLLAWLGGAALQLQQPTLGPMERTLALVGSGVAGGLLAVWAAAWRPALPLLAQARRLLPLLLPLWAALLGFGSTEWRAAARLAERLPEALERQDLLVTGTVRGLPQTSAAGTRFLFDVEAATLRGSPVQLPPLLSLGWYLQHHDEALLADPTQPIGAGQRWQLPLRLKRPQGTQNPGVYDVELTWFEQGVGAVGYVRQARNSPAPRLLHDAAAHPVDRLRDAVRRAIAQQVADGRIAGVLAALAVGDQAGIDRSDWELFRVTGIAHLVSISGVHVTMLAWLAGLAVAWAWRLSPRAMLWLPAPRAARWLGLAAAAAYALLAGWGVPAQRTVAMLAAAVLLRSLAWRWPWPLVLLAAAAVVTAIDPWALLQPGFWLSFVAVGLLMASEPAAGGRGEGLAARVADSPGPAADGTPARAPELAPDAAAVPPPPGPGPGQRRAGWLAVLQHIHLPTHLPTHLHTQLRAHLRAQWVATLGLAPLSLLFFQQISLVGLLANLVAIPLVTLLITPLALAGMLLPWAWWPAAWLLQGLVWGLQQLSALPLAVWTVPAAPAWIVAGCALGAVLGLLPLPRSARWLAMPLVLPMLWPPVPRPAEGRFEALAVDVGQGTAVLVRTRGHLLLYDAGPQYSRETDAGQRILLPLLRHRGEARIDRLVLSHRDADHVGGAAALLQALPVGSLLSTLEPTHALRQGPTPQADCRAGQHWQWDGVQFSVLHPTEADVAQALKPNAVSCVLRVQDAAGRSLLLTGDIEAAQEAALLQRHGAAALASTVLLVPHHGSRTSSSPGFIAAVAPQAAVVQAGYMSRFGHPAPDVEARYADQGITVVRTDRCGAWLWQDGHGRCTRMVQLRYWHAATPVGGAIVANPRHRP